MRPSTALLLAVIAAGSISLLSSRAQEAAPAADSAAVSASWQHLALPRDASLPMSDPDFAAKINKLGREGWELVTVTNFASEGTTTKTVYYFKKPL